MSLPDSSLDPEIGAQHPVTLSPSHFAMACQALSLCALFCQDSTRGKLPSTVWKEIGSLFFIWGFHSQELEALSLLAQIWLLIFSLANPLLQNAIGRGSSQQPLERSPKPMAWSPVQCLWGHPEGCWGEGWGYIFALSAPADSGMKSSENWCNQLLGGSGNGVVPQHLSSPRLAPVLLS